MVIQGVDAEARAAGAVVEVVAHDNLLLVQSTCKVYHTVRGAANLCLFISIIVHGIRGLKRPAGLWCRGRRDGMRSVLDAWPVAAPVPY